MDDGEMLVKEDIQSMYLGNLRTVEHDLKLPTNGKNGSKITWKTSDDRYISNDGKVTRPTYGRGDRVIQLTASFTYGGCSQDVVYDVNVLEEENNIVIDEIFPIEIKQEVNTPFYLPQVVSVKTEKGEILPQYVHWNDGEFQIYDQPGTYDIEGLIDATDYKVFGNLTIKEKLQNKVKRNKKVHAFNLKDIDLSPGTPVYESQQLRLKYLKTVNDDQMLIEFRKAAGLDTKEAPDMIGWDSPESNLKGHTTGHYLSALALAYASSDDQVILNKLNYMVKSLAEVQEKFEEKDNVHPGFLSAYDETQFDLLEKYTPYPEIWAPYYTLHKILAGLIDCYELAGSYLALLVANKIGLWVYDRLSKLDTIQLKKMWSMYIAGEFGGMNESLAKLATLTGESKFIQAAKYFDNDKLFYPMTQRVDALGSLHANQHIPQVIGALELYNVSQEDKYYQIAKFFWDSVVNHHVYSFGGTGDGEMFQQPDVIGAKLNENSAESCASYNMAKLTGKLYKYDADIKKMDYYENVMINHILSSADHDGIGGSTYFMGTQPGAQKGFDIDNTCCHGTGLESQFKYGEGIYFYNEDYVYVNMYISSKVKSKGVELELKGDFDDPKVVSLKVKKIGNRKIALRKPSWSKDLLVTTENGQPQTLFEDNGYFILDTDDCIDGQVLKIELEPELRFIPTPDFPEVGSIAYGPYVLAALSDNKQLIELNIKGGRHLQDLFVKEKDCLEFVHNNIHLIPLFAVNKDPYSVYFKKKRQ